MSKTHKNNNNKTKNKLRHLTALDITNLIFQALHTNHSGIPKKTPGARIEDGGVSIITSNACKSTY
jgi:hypothetical protein